jgi:phage baseplate assembly protein gpV
MENDPQIVDFPNHQPYEGKIVSRDDPQNLGRVRVMIDGYWEPYGPWCAVVGGKSGGEHASTPPIGSDVLVFFVNGNAENARVLAGHLGVGEVPNSASVASDAQSKLGNGDTKVIEDERVRITIDASSVLSYGVRIEDKSTGGQIASLDVDMSSGQVGLDSLVGVSVKSKATVRIEAPLVTINGRPVAGSGPI